jgi:aspartyl-tRNA(Asn)/glutamyl-tRNA(Gln) amidotransferase subunit C
MKISEETIDKMAHLSRLELSDSEKESMKNDLTNIVTWMEQLNEVDTSGIEPLTHMSEEVNVFRDDVPNNNISRIDALVNSPANDDLYFSVPKVIE